MRTRSDEFINLFYPEGITCNVCRRELNDDEREFSICTSCAALLAPVKNNPVSYEGVKVYSCFSYDTAARKYILDNKDFDNPYLSKYMARYLFKLYKEFNLSADTVCYVPSSPTARRRRGYDAMKLIAEEFSRLSEIPVSHLLFRVDGVDQTKLNARERAKNIKNKFLSRGGFSGDALLIDDVIASGATIKACAEVILSHGARSVTALTFAQT